MQSSNKETAVAAVVQNFLPVLDELKTLKEAYGEDEFGSKYAGLTGAMLGGLKELGVEEFTVAEGDAVNPQRVSVVEEEFSEEVEKGSIIRPVSMGMEVAGNVMRLAQVVASLGSESESAGSDDGAHAAAEADVATEAAPSEEAPPEE
jgi:molecular chaperone GrpE (heat shock protein)